MAARLRHGDVRVGQPFGWVVIASHPFASRSSVADLPPPCRSLASPPARRCLRPILKARKPLDLHPAGGPRAGSCLPRTWPRGALAFRHGAPPSSPKSLPWWPLL